MRKKIKITLQIFLVFWIFCAQWDRLYANTFIEKKIGNATLRVIDYDISSNLYDLKVLAVWTGTTTLDQLLLQNNALTGVNGVFFCPSDYPECHGDNFTINERYINGKKIGKYDDTGERVVFAWGKDKKPFLFQTGKINKDKEKDIFEWVANHPLLLKDGQNMLENYYDNFLIDKKMIAHKPRNFICSDKEKKHIYFWYVYTPQIDELVQILLEFWCYDAINLDAWKSASFNYNGRILAKWERPILDGVWIVRKWLNLEQIDSEASKNYADFYSKYMLLKTNGVRIKTLEFLSKKLDEMRIKIYDNNGTDIFDTDNKKVGFTIQIDDEKLLKKVYFLNRIEEFIKKDLRFLRAQH